MPGCYQLVPYGPPQLVTPCPLHVVCAGLSDLSGQPFCPPPGSDYTGEDGTVGQVPGA